MSLQLESNVRINDGFSPAIAQMAEGMRNLISSMQQMAGMAGSAFPDDQVNKMSGSVRRLNDTAAQMRPAIDQNAHAQMEHNKAIQNGAGGYDNMISTIKRVAGAIGGLIAVQKGLSLSNQLINDEARLKMMLRDGETIEGLRGKVQQSAIRSSAGYESTLQNITKLGLQAKNAFANNDQIVQFSENMNKAFSIAGATGMQRESAMYNLTQALASGVLRGQDFNAVMQSAPNIFDYVASYISKRTGQSADVVRKNIRQMAFEGKLSADTIVNAMSEATDDINKKFNEMPFNFENIMTRLNNYAMFAFQPISDMIKDIVNAPAFLRAVDMIGMAFIGLGKLVGTITNFIKAHWDIVRWVLLGIAMVIAALVIPAVVKMGAAMLAAAIKAVIGFLLTHWVLLLVVGAIIGAIIVCQKLGITARDVVQFIVGAFYFLGACIADVFIVIYNLVIGVFEFIANLVADVVYFICEGWYKLQIGAINAFNSIASGFAGLINGMIEKFEAFLNFFVDGWNGILDKINSVSIKIPDWVPEVGGNTLGFNLQHASRINLGRVSAPQISTAGIKAPTRQHYNFKRAEIINPMDAFKAGQKKGGELFDGGMAFLKGLGDDLKNAMNPSTAQDTKNALDKANGLLGDAVKAGKDGAKAGKGTKKNTDKMAKAKELERIQDDLDLMKSIAERRAIINVTWDKLIVPVNNSFGDVHKTADLDGWLPTINDAIGEAINASVGSVAPEGA